jgi:hypothetical protein
MKNETFCRHSFLTLQKWSVVSSRFRDVFSAKADLASALSEFHPALRVAPLQNPSKNRLNCLNFAFLLKCPLDEK